MHLPYSGLCLIGTEEMRGKLLSIAALSLGLFLIATIAYRGATPTGCSPIYQDAAWTISTCPTDPSTTDTMVVWLNGVEQPEPTARLEIAHLTDDGTSRPTVAVLYASGFVRLKQNADPTPPIPFGSSFILGPAYWPDATTLDYPPSARHRLVTHRSPTDAGPGHQPRFRCLL